MIHDPRKKKNVVNSDRNEVMEKEKLNAQNEEKFSELHSISGIFIT